MTLVHVENITTWPFDSIIFFMIIMFLEEQKKAQLGKKTINVIDSSYGYRLKIEKRAWYHNRNGH